jgi:hypothetical protein
MALGSPRRHVLVMVFRDGVLFVAAGPIGGLVGARFLTRLIASNLCEVSPSDPATLAMVSGLPSRGRCVRVPVTGVSRDTHRPDGGASV